MANYTVGDVRSQLDGYTDATPVFGFIISPDGIEVPDGEGGYRDPKHAEWEQIVNEAEWNAGRGSHAVWDILWELINEARQEVCPEEDE